MYESVNIMTQIYVVKYAIKRTDTLPKMAKKKLYFLSVIIVNRISILEVDNLLLQ